MNTFVSFSKKEALAHKNNKSHKAHPLESAL